MFTSETTYPAASVRWWSAHGVRCGLFLAGLLLTGHVSAALIAWVLQGEPLATALGRSPLGIDDLVTWALSLSMLVLDLLVVGWSGSCLKRLVEGDSATVRTDMFYAILMLSGLSAVVCALGVLGVVHLLNAAFSLSPLFPAIGRLDWWIGAPLLYLLASFFVYWKHRAMHTRWFFPFHAVHHSAEEFTMLTAARLHPFDNGIEDVVLMVPLALLGFGADAVLGASVIASVIAMYNHSDLPSADWLERWVLIGPWGHRVHHSVHPEDYDTNFGSVVLWDRLFGTYRASGVGGPAVGVAPGYGPLNQGRPIHEIGWAYSACLSEAARSLRDWRGGRRHGAQSETVR